MNKDIFNGENETEWKKSSIEKKKNSETSKTIFTKHASKEIMNSSAMFAENSKYQDTNQYINYNEINLTNNMSRNIPIIFQLQ